MAPRKLKSKLVNTDNHHEFYCVSCKVKRKKRVDKNVCLRTFKMKNGRISYQMYSNCDQCKTKVMKFISKVMYDALLAGGKVEVCKKE